MQGLSLWPERQARVVRWCLLIGWGLLILSLLIPALQLPEALAPQCDPEAAACVLHREPGNRLFWGVVVPSSVLMLVVLSHELWRRICPLAFLSQLFRHLGWQRQVLNKQGKPVVVKIDANSWLGRHHIQLQWSLLIAGLCLRLLVVNASPIGLAALLLVTIAAALLVGWAYGGKAWCQYFCPMGPVQTVITGQRGALGSTAHLGPRSKTSQSTCRTVRPDGSEQSACVACQAPCIDIDAERAFWQQLKGKRGLRWAWYSYPGLVLMFFELMMQVEAHLAPPNAQLSYLRYGKWAFDASLTSRALDPLNSLLPLPKLLAVPLLLSLGAWLSVRVFSAIEGRLQRGLTRIGYPDPSELAISRTRLLATFLAVNSFFWFVDPTQGAMGPHGGQWIRSLVLTVSAIVLFRGWGRDQATYRRESASDSLRRQLKDLPGLEAALDGRQLDQLPAQEVFTLAKALPLALRSQMTTIYRGVVRDMLDTGRLDQASALVQLAELRDALDLSTDDHLEVMRVLAEEEPALQGLDQRERQLEELRREALADALEQLLGAANVEVLNPGQLRPELRQQLERLQANSGLEAESCQAVLSRFAPEGDIAQQRLQQRCQRLTQELGLQRLLEQEGQRNALFNPLAVAMGLKVAATLELVQQHRPKGELAEMLRNVSAAGSLEEAFAMLWLDPDPDTAGWTLMLQRTLQPAQVAINNLPPRPGLGSSPFLQAQLAAEPEAAHPALVHLATSTSFADLPPAGLIWVLNNSSLRHATAGELLRRSGEPSSALLLILQGGAVVQSNSDQQQELGPDQTIDAQALMRQDASNDSIIAGSQGAELLVFPKEAFEALMQRSNQFTCALLRQLSGQASG